LHAAEFVHKAGYDPGESRDQYGRWAAGAAAAIALVGERLLSTMATAGVASTPVGVAAVRAAGGASIFGGISATAVDGLAAIGEAIAAPAAFFGAYFFPRTRSAVGSGDVPDHPGVSYEYDDDTGSFVLLRDGAPIFGGSTDWEGLVRDPEGNVVGRRVPGSVILDSDALDDVLETNDSSEANADAQVGSTAGAQAIAQSQPKLCPDPGPDRPGFKSPRSIAYQLFINEFVNPEMPTPPGLAYNLWDPVENKFVSIDDCFQDSGAMAEAKGAGYATMLAKGNAKLTAGIDARLLRQATKQVQAAQGRPLIWFFRESMAAEHARVLFASSPTLSRIAVVWEPMPFDKRRRYAQIAEYLSKTLYAGEYE
jgi:hypothetical protein